MTITITGCAQAPRWETTERFIGEALDAIGHLTRISRDDGAAGYRAKGSYSLEFARTIGETTTVKLVIE